MNTAQRYVLFFGLLYLGYTSAHYCSKPDMPRPAARIGGEIVPAALIVASIFVLVSREERPRRSHRNGPQRRLAARTDRQWKGAVGP